uniref:chemerin-like receptor 1 n=1 Tax=Pristiophorus japonicus TaxID=55135 RepID=UPI00398EE3CE
MEPDDFQPTNSSEVPHDVPATEVHSSTERAMHACAVVIYIVTCVLGMSGNGLVIWATGFKLKRTAYTVWLQSLAVADFTVSLLLPLYITDIALDFHWPFGWLICKLSYGAVVLCLHANVFTLAAISVDRCFSVVLPVWSQNHRSPRLATLLSLGMWVAAAIGSAPSCVFRQLISRDDHMWCFTEYLLEGEGMALNTTDRGEDDDRAVPEQAKSLHDARYRTLTLTSFLIGFLLPFLVITASYTIIVLRLRRDRLVSSGSKAFRIVAAIILAFLVCWAPYHIVSILALLLHPHDEDWPMALMVGVPFSRGLACINSCINPFLYLFMWQDFRDLLKKSFQRVDNQGEAMQTHL